MRFASILIVAAVAASGAAFLPRTAQADEAATPAAYFDRGVRLFQEGDYHSALVEFRRSYELSKNWRVLYNVAQTQYQMLDYASARATFKRYLAEGGALVAPDRRAEIEAGLVAIDERVGYLQVSVDAEGAEVVVDDGPPATSPLASEVVVNSGTHRIRATKPGYSAAETTVEIAGSERNRVALHLVPDRGPESPAVREEPVPAPALAHAKVPWISVGFTGLFAVGASVYGGLALDASSKLKQDRERLGVTSGELASDSERVRVLGVVSDACLVGALLSGGITAYLFFRAPREPRKTAAAPEVHLTVGVDHIGVIGRW